LVHGQGRGRFAAGAERGVGGEDADTQICGPTVSVGRSCGSFRAVIDHWPDHHFHKYHQGKLNSPLKALFPASVPPSLASQLSLLSLSSVSPCNTYTDPANTSDHRWPTPS
jgi:hypothetical protein